MKINNRLICMMVATVVLIGLPLGPLQAAEEAARVQFVVGKVYATAESGTSRRLSKGDRIYSGDLLESSRSGTAQLVFSDQGRMAVRANTTVKIHDYNYDAENSEKSNSFITLFGGAIRSITGFIGSYNKNAVVLTTPLATIGIRGTDHETVHITPDFEGGEETGLAGTYNKVYSGGTSMRSSDGIVNLDPNQVGFVAGIPGSTLAPVLIDDLPQAVEDLLVRKIPRKSIRTVAGLEPTGADSSDGEGESSVTPTEEELMDLINNGGDIASLGSPPAFGVSSPGLGGGGPPGLGSGGPPGLGGGGPPGLGGGGPPGLGGGGPPGRSGS